MKHPLLIAVFLAGCGRPATTDECQEIVARIARLEATRANPGQSEKIEEEVRKAQTDPVIRDRAMKECVGHPITDRALTCIRDAKTSQEILDRCLH